jgi:hypothetical protein
MLTCNDEQLPPQTLNAGNNYTGKFEFKAGEIPTKVEIVMLANCTVTVTRKCATVDDLMDRCSNPEFADIFPEMEEKENVSTETRYSLYQIEASDCSDLAYPSEIYIAYFGTAEKVLSTNAYRLRMIKAPKNSKDCTDVT